MAIHVGNRHCAYLRRICVYRWRSSRSKVAYWISLLVSQTLHIFPYVPDGDLYRMKQVWGTWGYLFPMAIRVFLSFVWTSTNTWYGGQCLKVFLTCLWPSYANLNTELANGTMTTGDFAAFVLFIGSCLPLMWFSPERFRKPFLLCSTIVGTTVFVLLIWSTKRAGGGGALLADVSGVSGIKSAKGGRLGWAFVSAVTANIGGIATHMFSQSDYTRYARKPGDQVLAQLVMVPLGTIIVACIGIVCTSCAAQLYPQTGKLLWQPYAFLDAIRRYEDNSGARAGVAFASLAFIFAQYGKPHSCQLPQIIFWTKHSYRHGHRLQRRCSRY